VGLFDRLRLVESNKDHEILIVPDLLNVVDDEPFDDLETDSVLEVVAERDDEYDRVDEQERLTERNRENDREEVPNDLD
jgi:hypothetical protein